MTTLRDIQNKMTKAVYGQTLDEALDTQLCIKCKEPAIAKCYSPAGIKEYNLSGLCEECFDAIMAENDEDEDGWGFFEITTNKE